MAGDLKCLLATWQQFLEEPLQMEGVLDLLNIHQKVTWPHSDNRKRTVGAFCVLLGVLVL